MICFVELGINTSCSLDCCSDWSGIPLLQRSIPGRELYSLTRVLEAACPSLFLDVFDSSWHHHLHLPPEHSSSKILVKLSISFSLSWAYSLQPIMVHNLLFGTGMYFFLSIPKWTMFLRGRWQIIFLVQGKISIGTFLFICKVSSTGRNSHRDFFIQSQSL